MEFTGERFIPEIKGQIELEHLHRYSIAKTLARGKNVLDIASGEGYGSAMLAEVANRVIGVDISEEAVRHARNKYKLENLEFRVGTCAEIPVGNASINLVVSFETIEHHGQHDEMLSEIKRVLHPRGILIMSSPDKYGYSVLPNHSNPFHVKELFRDEFEGLLRKYFRYHSMYGQRVIYGSGIFSPERGRSFQIFEKDESRIISQSGMPKPIYEIALAADMKLPVLDNSVFEQKFNDSEIVLSWSQAVTDRDEQIAKLNQAVTDRDERIARLNQAVTDRDEQIARLNQTVQALSSQVAQKEEALGKLYSEVDEKEQTLRELQSSVAQKEQAARELDAVLRQIQSSQGWKVLQLYYRLRDRVLPEGSRRRNATKFVWRVATRQPVSIPKPRLSTPANFKKYLWYCKIYGVRNATSRAFRKLRNPNAVHQPVPLAEPDIAKFAIIISGCPGDALRYRSEYQAEELRFLGLTVDTALFDRVDYDRILSQYEMFLLHRVPHTPGIEAFIKQAKNIGKPVIFDADDLIFNEELISHIKAIKDFPVAEYSLYRDGVRRYYRTLSLCSAAIVTTEHLRDSVKELFPEMPVYINRNAMGDMMFKQADLALQMSKPDDFIVRIVYLSGSRTHQEDFEQCVPALEKLLKKYRMARLMLVGHIEVPEWLMAISDQIERIPLMPWQELPALMRRVDINLFPLELNNRFTEAKSELKYFEAGLLGVPTLATDLPSCRFAITHGHNGFLCTTEDDWFNALEKLVLDPVLRAQLGSEARRDVLRRYSTRTRAPELQAVLRKVLHQESFSSSKPMSIAFVMRAPIAQIGGGYKNIFALGHYLAERGHDVHLYVEPIAHLAGMKEREIVDFCHKFFGKSSAQIHVGHENILSSDIAIATNWPTAYTVDVLGNTKCKAYLVQDFEPDFYDKSDPNYLAADQTYDLALKKIALGRYLATLFSRRDRLPIPSIKFSLDRSIYRNSLVRPEKPVRILFFARPGLKRRAYHVGVDALRLVARACPNVQIAFYGMAMKENVHFDYTNLGELSREEVAREMNKSHIHLSFSLTNISWVPFEAMACGCAVVEAKVPSVEHWVGTDDGNCILSVPEPEKVAESLIKLVRDADLRKKLAVNGEKFLSTISSSWGDTCREFENILKESLFRKGAANESKETLQSLLQSQQAFEVPNRI